MHYIFLEEPTMLSNDQRGENAHYRVTSRAKAYINRTAFTVYVKDRTGLETEIPPDTRINSAYPSDFFYIIDYIHGTRDVFNDYCLQARRLQNNQRSYLMKFVNSPLLRVSLANDQYSLDVLSKISTAQLEQYNGVVHLTEHDITLVYNKTEEQRTSIAHPNSLVGNIHHIGRGGTERFGEDFNITITIIDNEQVFGERWVIVGDAVFCVKPRIDLDVNSGVYITYNKDGEQLADRFDFEQYQQLPYYTLYHSRAEALGELAKRDNVEYKLKIKELDAKRITAENNLYKAEQEKELLEREYQHKEKESQAKLDRYEREREKLTKEHENYLEKDRLEKESLIRKNTLDILKYVPAVLTTITCIVTMLSASKKS